MIGIRGRWRTLTWPHPSSLHNAYTLPLAKIWVPKHGFVLFIHLNSVCRSKPIMLNPSIDLPANLEVHDIRFMHIFPIPKQEEYDQAYATNSTTPPASVIFRSASLLNHLARTINGTSGILPLPRTLEYPSGSKSRTGRVSVFLPARYSSRFSAGTRDQS